MNRPITTLFMLMSVDGKISTGFTDNLDMDKDLPKVPVVKDGLHQYYEIEQTTDLWTMSSGRIQAKIGANEDDTPDKSVVSYVVIDNMHLTEKGIDYICSKAKEFVLVTTNKAHPAFNMIRDNLYIIYQKELSIKDILEQLKTQFNCDRLTIQTGGTLNSILVRSDLIDYVDIVVAPVLIGGKDTSTLIDGKSFTSELDLKNLRLMDLISCETLKHSYLRLKYKVIHGL